jgi:hypothetical protein
MDYFYKFKIALRPFSGQVTYSVAVVIMPGKPLLTGQRV